ncbi:MAG: TatD family hydrolase [Planctomycetota bacterium]|nr:TatD family hydrolase [Planctomycetota bacterium]
MIDTHCHLTFPDFAGDEPGAGVAAELAEAARHGVTGCITISTTTRDCTKALAIAQSHARVWCSAGVHPLYADQGPHDWQALERCIAERKCVAWGELGLDNHYPEPGRDVQHAVLAEQLAFIERVHRARPELEKPVVLHCREAFADLIPILKRTTLKPDRFVFHCFTGSPADMRMLLDFGASVSFTGVLTYRNAADVREAAKLVPSDRLMVETDAPFLPPEPVRGKRPCRPWMVRHTAEHLASVRGLSFEAMHERLNTNTEKFFGIV